jgi:hypothetical protein
MGYNIQGFQSSRGNTTTYASGNGVTAIPHTYKSTVDALAAITTPGYFPPNFNVATDEVFIHDWLFIVDNTGNSSFVVIDGVSPVTLSPDLFIGGGGLNVGAAIPAVDDNGIVISGATVSMEIADELHSGIVIADPQVFGGTKTFAQGMRVNIIEGILAADQMFIGNNQTAAITIGGLSASVFVPSTVVTDNISNALASGTLNLHAAFDGITIVGQDTASVTTGLRTNKIDTITPGGFPLVIGALSNFPVTLGSAGLPILAQGGIEWGSTVGAGTIDYYNVFDTTVSWTGPFAGSVPGKVTITRENKIATMVISGIPATAVTSSNPITVLGVIPVALRPLTDAFDLAYVVDNTVFAIGAVVASNGGNITVFANVGQGPFAATGVAGFQNITLSWDVTNT